METKKINLGRVGLVPKGAYSPETTYGRLHVVTYKNTTYCSKQEGNTGHEPVGEDDWWSVLVDGQAAYAGAADAKKAAERANTAAERAEQVNADVETAEQKRASAEEERKTAEEQREAQAQSFANAEQARIDAEQQREATMSKTKADCEAATKKATDAANEANLSKTNADTATENAQAATAEAEKVNATITAANVLEVTGRDGVKKTLDLASQADAATIKAGFAEKFDKANVVQELGEAEDKVVSQKVVNEKITDLLKKVDGIEQNTTSERSQSIDIIKDNGERIMHIGEDGVDIPGLKINGKASYSNEKISNPKANVVFDVDSIFYLKSSLSIYANANVEKSNILLASICGKSLQLVCAEPSNQVVSDLKDEWKDGCPSGKKYPIAITRSGFSFDDKTWIPNEKENRLVGDILFGLYIKKTLSPTDSYVASFNGRSFTVNDGTADVISIDCSTFNYATDLYDALKTLLADNDTFAFLDNQPSMIAINDILHFTNIQLVEDYSTDGSGNYKSYPLFFRNAVCSRCRLLEVIGRGGKLTVAIDGKVIVDSLDYSDDKITLPYNDNIHHIKIDFTNGSTGEAELINGKILSPYSPQVFVTTNHVLLNAKEYPSTEAITSAYKNGDIPKTLSGNFYQPVSLGWLRKWIWEGKKSGWDFISLKQYSDYLNGKIDRLPKRCFVFIFDDQEYYIPGLQEFRKVFDQYGAVGTLCWQRWQTNKDTNKPLDDVIKAPYYAILSRLNGWGFVLHDEGIINAGELEQVKSTLFKYMNNLYVDTSIMVSSGHGTSPSGREEMEYLGYCTMVAGSGSQGLSCNRYHLKRVYVNEGSDFKNVVNLI